MPSHLLILQSVNFFYFLSIWMRSVLSSSVLGAWPSKVFFEWPHHMRSPANISEAEVTNDDNSSLYTLQTDGWGDVPFTGKICSVADACQLPFPALLHDFIELTRLRNCWNWFLLLNTADLILKMQGGLCLRWCKLAQLQWKVSGAEPLRISHGAALKGRSLKRKRRH